MARQTPLGQVRSACKAELAKSLLAASTAQDAELNQIIFDIQQWLGSEYDWPFLSSRWTINVPTGSRYISFPTTTDTGIVEGIDFERAGELKFYIKWFNIWQEINYGINEIEEFNYIDSDRGQTLDPIQRWKFDDQGKFEIWPMNASAQQVRFVGQRTFIDLRSAVGPPPTWSDTALLDLDDLLVTYYVCAEYCARQEQLALSKAFGQLASNRMQLVRATYPKREMPPTIVGNGTTFNRRALRIVPMVVVGGR